MVPLLLSGSRRVLAEGRLSDSGPGGHETTSTVVILDSSRRMASIAV